MDFKEFAASKGYELEGKSAEEMAGYYNEFNQEKRTEIENLIEGKATKEDIEALKEQLRSSQEEQMKQLNEALKTSQTAFKKIVTTEKAKTVNDLKAGLDSVKEKLTEMKSDKSKRLSIKAPATMLNSGNISGGNVPVEQRLAGFNTVPSRRVRLLDIVSLGVAESNIISWVYQANKDGAAGQTAEGSLKNQIDFDLVVNSESLKKSTAYIKISDEMLEDVSFIESEIRNELMRELVKTVEAQVYEGDGTGQNHNGIRTVASAFAAGAFAGAVDNANIVDVLVAAMDQIKIAEQDAPDYILMYPSDLTSLKLQKVSTSDDRYIDRLQMVAGQMSLDGVPIIETTLVASGEYLIGNFALASVYNKGGISIDFGYENDDFTKNLVTVRAEWRGLTLVRNNDRSAFVAGDFATDKAALETP